MSDFISSETVLSNRVLASLRPEAQEFMARHGKFKEMQAGEVLFENGELVTHVVFPQEGVISIIAEMEGGRSVEKLSIGPEGFVGFTIIMGGGTSLGKSVVQLRGTALWVSIANLDVAFEKFFCVREVMLRYAKSLIVQLMESVACNSLHTAKQRVSRWLAHAHDRVNGDTFYLTQESIAKNLALRRATVNSICSELMDAGAIVYRRGEMTIRDQEILHSQCCECYDRVRSASLRKLAWDRSLNLHRSSHENETPL